MISLGVCGDSGDPWAGAESGTSLTDMLANFYPEEMLNDLGGFGLDTGMMGTSW